MKKIYNNNKSYNFRDNLCCISVMQQLLCRKKYFFLCFNKYLITKDMIILNKIVLKHLFDFYKTFLMIINYYLKIVCKIIKCYISMINKNLYIDNIFFDYKQK